MTNKTNHTHQVQRQEKLRHKLVFVFNFVSGNLCLWKDVNEYARIWSRNQGQGWPYFDLGTISSLEPKQQRRQVAAAYLVTSLSYCHHKKIGLRHSDIRSGAISKTEKYMVSLLPFAFGMGFGNRRNNYLVTTRLSRSIAIIHYRLLVHKFKTLKLNGNVKQSVFSKGFAPSVWNTRKYKTKWCYWILCLH